MRIDRLTIAGFGPYKSAQHIDFDAFADDGIFLITGNTGAGKSSILDAICFALYASVPRYEGTQQQLRSDYCEPGDPSYVELWFSTGGQHYRVRRSPEYERLKKSGVGTTKSPAAAELFIRVGEPSGVDAPAGEGAGAVSPAVRADEEGEWQGVAAIPRDVGIALDGILGLSKDQFLQVILLAQNRFQKFLHAKNDERQTVLQSLFGTRRFADIERALVERRKELEARQAESAGDVADLARQASAIVDEADPDADTDADAGEGTGTGAQAEVSDRPSSSTPDRAFFERSRAQLSTRLAVSTKRVAHADAAFIAADAALHELENIRRLQTRRDEAAARLVDLEQAAEAIEHDRRELDAAARAEIVWAHVSASTSAQLALDQALEAEQLARAAYVEGIAQDTAAEEITPTALAAEANELTLRLGALELVLADEQRIVDLKNGIDELDELEVVQQDALSECSARAQRLPVDIDQLVEQRNAALIVAASRSEADTRVSRLIETREAAVLSDSLETELDAARTLEKARSAANREAAALYDDMLARRLDGHAAELASTLIDGEPCAVCGSTDHPNPTEWSSELGEPVSDADLDAQRQQLAKAADELARAGLTVQEVVARHAAAASASAHRSVAEIDAELDIARHSLTAATLAATEAETLGVRIAELRTELEQITSRLEELRATVQSTQTQRATIVSELASITERVALHREGFDTVADRVDALRTRLVAVRDFEMALLEHAEKAAALDRAQHTLRLQLDEQRFADAAQVTAARLTVSQKTAATTRISTHDAARAATAATLAEPELQQLPDALVELDHAVEARDAASVERDDARVEAGSLADRTSRLRAIVTDALELLEASEALRVKYETLRSLANSVEGAEPNTMRMRLESYVLAAQLEEIIRAANARLAVMTSGRYSLEHDDSVQYRNTRSGLGIAILDQHTGRARATHSLSGGETFLASLALALGLAEVVSNQAGGITLDTLFIDEGFGSLDADTLAIAMSTLDSLRSGGRTIGLISHVEAMKEQIPSRLRITVTPQGFSEIDQRS